MAPRFPTTSALERDSRLTPTERIHKVAGTISYAQGVYRRQKADLTRAIKTDDAGKILTTVKAAVARWNDPEGPFKGAWPDDWSRWQRALDDSRPWHERVDISTL